MQVIITMAGLGQRFKDSGEMVAKPFISVGGKSVLKHLTDVLPADWNIYFAVGEHLRSAETESEIQKLNRENSEIKYVPYSARGPIDTVQAVLSELNPSESVLVSYCAYTMIWDAEDFINQIQNTNSDAAIVSYKGFHPTYLGPNSYCHLKVDTNGFVTDLQEKKLFTENLETEWTSCGMYYFKSVEFLKDCLSEQLKQVLCCRNLEQPLRAEYYTSLALKAMKNKKPETKILNYEIKYFIQFGTPFDIQLYEYWKNYFSTQKNLTQ